MILLILKGLLKYSHPLTVDEARVNFPRVKFVIAHCGCPWITDAAEVAGKNPNVCMDLSGLLEGNPKPYAADFFAIYVPGCNYMGDYSRVMYGSDWPLINIDIYINMIALVIPQSIMKTSSIIMLDVFSEKIEPLLNK